MNIKDMQTSPVILGIDFGSYRTGLAAITIKNPGLLVCKARIDAVGEDPVVRWDQTIQHLEKFLLEFVMGRPIVVAIEQPNAFRNGKTVRELVGGWGATCLWLHRNGMTVMDINTTHAKAVFCGKGGGGKQQTLDKANELYDLTLKYHRDPVKSDDDISDAIQVAWVLRKELIESDEWFEKASQSS